MKLPAPNQTQKVGFHSRWDDVWLVLIIAMFAVVGIAMIVEILR